MSPSSVEFQCVICFDDFDHDEKPPVVLPCGHTMVCAPCAKRLSRCMECRTSLFISAPAQQTSQLPSMSPSAQNRYTPSARYRSVSASSSFGSPRRYNHIPVASTPSTPRPQTEQQIPLPLPKNLVMLELMEEDAREKRAATADIKVEGDEPGEDLLIETCGTYEVRDRDGLLVLPDNPTNGSEDGRLTGKDSIKKGFWRRKKKRAGSKINWPKESQSSEAFKDEKRVAGGCVTSILVPSEGPGDCDTVPSSASVSKNHSTVYGQKLQVVHIEEGVAKLARGRGYVVADSTQLVKVGDAEDHICQMEAKMSNIAKIRERLRKTLSELDAEEAELKGDMQLALSNGSYHPVIESTKPDDNQHRNTSSQRPPSPLSPPLISPRPAQSNLDTDISHRRPCVESPSNIPRLPTLTKESVREEGTFLSRSFDGGVSDNDTGCVERMLGLNQTGASQQFNDRMSTRTPTHNTRDNISPRATAGDWIDFRTGMSGHMGLSSRRTATDRPQSTRGEIRMMSEHRGASRIKPIRNPSSSTAHYSPSIQSRPTW